MEARACLSRTLLAAAVLGLAAFASTDTTLAQSYPSRPIRLIIGASPGGASDAYARVLAPRLAEVLGQQIVIDNRPGANGNIAMEIVARAQADGYTLLWGLSTNLVINPSLYKNVPFDPQKDFAPILLLGSQQLILVVHRSVQANSVQELIALVKSSKPGQFQYASGGVGSPNHLAAVLFMRRTALDILHVPYKGGGPATVSVLSGETKILFASLASVVPHIKAGSLKALAVTAPKRSSEAPDTPTMQESGFPGFDVRTWHGVLATAGTSKAIVAHLYRELLKVVSMPDAQEALKREGLELSTGTPEEFAALIKSETALWAKVIKEAGIRAD